MRTGGTKKSAQEQLGAARSAAHCGTCSHPMAHQAQMKKKAKNKDMKPMCADGFTPSIP